MGIARRSSFIFICNIGIGQRSYGAAAFALNNLNNMKYTENHKLGDIICDHYQLLLVMSRFGIPLGFGDKTVGEVCASNNVDSHTFLAVVNYVATGATGGTVSALSMMSFLKSAHRYYLEFFFPDLRRKLIEAIDFRPDNKLSHLMLGFFDNYVAAVTKHLHFEDTVVFSHVENMCRGLKPDGNFSITQYSRQHEKIDSELMELKNIMIKYYPDNGRANALNAVLYDIFACEADLKSHCDIEDNLFVPAVIELEEKAIARNNEK